MIHKITFRDVIKYVLGNEKVNPNISFKTFVENDFNTTYVDTYAFDLAGVNVKSIYTADTDYNLFSLLYSRFSDEIIYTHSSKLNIETFEDHKLKVAKFINKIYNVYTYKSDKYISLLTYYNNNRENLLNAIKVTSKAVNRFNDTPQLSGNYIDESYTSNIGINDNEINNEKDTLIMRLAEIQNHYKDVLNDFIDEFKRVFIMNMED